MSPYPEFLRNLAPTIIGLDSGTFLLNRFSYFDMPRGESERVLKSSYELKFLAEDWFDLGAMFELEVLWNNPKKEKPEETLSIRCAFVGHFHAPAPISKQHVDQFIREDAWVLFWPYFRQFVSDTTARMSIPPIMVPLALAAGETKLVSKTTRKELPAHPGKTRKRASKPAKS